MAFIYFGVLLVVGFVIWHGVAPNPLMRLRVWGDRNFSLVGVSRIFPGKLSADSFPFLAYWDHFIWLCSVHQ